jgi:hypothetical protein
MATALGRIQLSVYDNNRNRGSVLSHVSFDDGQTAAQLSTEIAAYATAFGNISDAGITAGTFDVVNKAVARAPVADANLPSGASFTFQPTVPAGVHSQWVPSIKDSVRGPQGTFDITAGAILAWCNLLVNSGAGAFTFTDTDYIALVTALKGFRSDRRGKRR